MSAHSCIATQWNHSRCISGHGEGPYYLQREAGALYRQSAGQQAVQEADRTTQVSTREQKSHSLCGAKRQTNTPNCKFESGKLTFFGRDKATASVKRRRHTTAVGRQGCSPRPQFGHGPKQHCHAAGGRFLIQTDNNLPFPRPG